MNRLEKYGYELLWKREIISVCKCGQLTKKHMLKAISTSDKLNALLNDAGLKVSSFEVFNEERPGNKIHTSKPILGEKIFSGITVDVEA